MGQTAVFTNTALQCAYDNSELSDAARESIARAFVSRGKRKGLLKANRPSDNGDAWEAIISNVAPVRMSVYFAMSMRDRSTYDEVDAWSQSFATLIQALHPYTFNLWAHRHDATAFVERWESLARGFEAEAEAGETFAAYALRVLRGERASAEGGAA